MENIHNEKIFKCTKKTKLIQKGTERERDSKKTHIERKRTSKQRKKEKGEIIWPK
jgi:hypothetical protein